MGKLVNRAKMSISNTGSGTLTLNAAVAGYLSFSAAGVNDGDIVSYVIEDGSAWEVGEGTYTASGTTLSRGPILSSNSNAAISASSTAQVFVSTLSQDLASRRDSILSRIGVAKALSAPQRGVNSYSDGFKSTTGISGSSVNVDTSNASASGYVRPGFSTQSTGGTASASSTFSGTFVAANAFDASTSTIWLNAAGLPAQLQYQLGTGVVATGYTMIGFSSAQANSTSARSPKTWTFEGSNNGTTWTTLDTQSSAAAFSDGESRSYTFSNSTSYTYYRWNFSASQSDASYVNVTDVAFGGTANMTLISTAQTADASCAYARAAFVISASPALTWGTDATVETTANGGINWTTTAPINAGAVTNGVLWEIPEAAVTAGSSFQYRFKTLTNKAPLIYGAHISVR